MPQAIPHQQIFYQGQIAKTLTSAKQSIRTIATTLFVRETDFGGQVRKRKNLSSANFSPYTSVATQEKYLIDSAASYTMHTGMASYFTPQLHFKRMQSLIHNH